MNTERRQNSWVDIGVAGILFLIAVSAVCGICSADANLISDQTDSQTILIKIDTSMIEITDILDRDAIIYDYSSLLPGTYAVKVPAGYTSDEVIAYYTAIPGVIYAEKDSPVHIATPTPSSTPASPAPVAGMFAGLGIVSALFVLRREY